MKVTEWREELKAAEDAIEAARDGLAAAKEEVRARQKRLDRAQKRRAEVLRAFISGESQLPLFEEGVEDDDEPASFVPVAADPSGVLTAAEADALEEELERQAAERSPFAPPAVNPGRSRNALGDPAKFAAALADAEDYSAMWSRPWLHSATLTIAGEAVEVEVGYKPERDSGCLRYGPPLSSAGYSHYGVGRLVDGVPTDLPERWRSRPYEYAERLAYHLARLSARPGREPADAPDAPAWRATPLEGLVIAQAERKQLARCGVKTAGDLADAIDLGADDARTDVETEAVLIPDGPWRAIVAAVEIVAGIDAAMLAQAEEPADDWARTPLVKVGIRGDLVAALKADGLLTLGDLADACDLCGSLSKALGDWIPADVLSVELDVRGWSSRRPGFPLDRLTPPEEPKRPLEEMFEALASAVDASDVEAWRPVAERDYDPRLIHERLSAMWPGQPTYFDDGPAPWFTVRGGDRPAFWLGQARPNAAAMCRPATWLGEELFAAVATVLRMAAVEAADAPVPAETPAAAPKKKARKKKPAAVAEARA